MFRNREFIYRGQRLIRRTDVFAKIAKFFTDASMFEYSAYPEKNVLDADKKLIQI